MTHGSLFSGGGGFDLAAEWMGWRNMFHCEINEFGRKILNYYWPNAKSYEDITKTDFTIWRGKIGVLTGGFPCQPFSLAGKRTGTEDNRFLWPEYLRAIREIQPLWIVAENVPGILSIERGLVFKRVCAEMEAEGYEVQPIIIPSVATNADHRRERIFFIAHRNGNGQRGGGFGEDTDQKGESKIERDQREWFRSEFDGEDTNAPNSNNSRDRTSAEGTNSVGQKGSGDAGGHNSQSGISGHNSYVTNANIKRLEGHRSNGERTRERFTRPSVGQETWYEAATRLCSVDAQFPGGLDGITFPKWRIESLKMAGNAVDPDVVFEIFKAIQSAE